MYTDAAKDASVKPAESALRRYAVMVKDAIFLASIVVAFLSFIGGITIKLAWPMFISQLSQDLDVATKEDLKRIQDQLDVVTGENRLIRMPSGQSYVREPVSVGDIIHLTLVLSRTKRGQVCNYISGVPIFIDDRGVPVPGLELPPVKQVSTTPERLLYELPLPPSVQPGRIRLTLALKYTCPFGSASSYIDVYEETDPVHFQLDP